MALLAAAILLAACGGSGSGSPGGTTIGGTKVTITGTAVKGAVNGGKMTAFATANGAKAQQLAVATTDAQGRFTMDLGDHTGPVLLELSGGTYTDEATGATMAMGAGDVMRAVVPTMAAGSPAPEVVVTPLSSMAQARAEHMAGGMTDANISAANDAVGRYFVAGDVLHVMPMDPLASGSGASASQEARNYGMAVAAMTQYAHDLGMTSSSGMVTAMMDDASDGVMDGMMGTAPISMNGMGGMMGGTMMSGTAGTKALASAMSEFMTSPANRSGVTPAQMQPLVEKLSTSTGTLR